MFLYILLVVIVVVVVLLKWQYSYWTRLGLYQIEPTFFFGNFKNEILGKSPFFLRFKSAYTELKALKLKHAGIYMFAKPIYIPIDPEIAKRILISDFSHFHGHGAYRHPNDILSISLFTLEGEQWRTNRSKLSPAFTSGKMKVIFDTMKEMTTGLVDVVGEYVDANQPIDIKEIAARFTTDIISSVAFGIESNTLKEGESDLRKNGRKMFKPHILRMIGFLMAPGWLLGPLNFKIVPQDVGDFFISTLRRIIKYRVETKVQRKDLMQILLEMKNNGTLTENEVISNSMSFFSAGHETSSTTMSFVLLELAQHPEIQNRVRNEIFTVLDKHGGEMTYDALGETTYLDMVINETLRLYPPGPIIQRVCNKEYPVPGTDLVLKTGTHVQIPLWGLQTDPEFYPNPEQFNPENFTAEKMAARPVVTFMPFGEGPRMCIGRRFGWMQTKVGLISLLANFNFNLSDKTHIPVQFENSGFVLSVKDEIWVNCTRI